MVSRREYSKPSIGKTTRNEELTARYGFVALLDALGVGSLEIEGCVRFIRKIDVIIEFLARKIEFYERFGIKEQPNYFIFQDSIIMTWVPKVALKWEFSHSLAT